LDSNGFNITRSLCLSPSITMVKNRHVQGKAHNLICPPSDWTWLVFTYRSNQSH